MNEQPPVLKSVYSCAEGEHGQQCKHADSYLKLEFRLEELGGGGDLPHPPTWMPHCLLNQAVCFVAVVFVFCFDCVLLMMAYDIT